MSYKITAKTPISTELRKILMDHLNKAHQDNKLWKKVVKKIQQNQTNTTKVIQEILALKYLDKDKLMQFNKR